MNAPRDWLAEEHLSVLVVGAADGALAPLERLVSRLGHRVVACTPADAEARYIECAPDLLLIDSGRTLSGALHTSLRLRALPGERWVPALYVVGREQEPAIAQALEAQADDYLTQPISVVVLRAKLRAAARALSLQRQNLRQQAALERYYHNAEEEQRVASHLMRRLIQTDMLSDPAVERRISSASHLSGDLIAFARTPGNSLHVLLADSTGHGLAASLGVMPLVQPFYAMTEKGFGLSAIAQEMSRKVCDWLPLGRFVAATLVSVDQREGVVCVWNGGNPPIVMLAEDGREIHRFESRHVPLGIGPLDDQAAAPERLALRPNAQLLAFSDGVSEAESPEGMAFGIERLVSIAAAAPRGARMQALTAALDEHLGGGSAHDDLALLLIDCGAAAVEDRAEPATRGGCGCGLKRWRFRVELTPDELRITDVVARLTGTMERMGVPEAHRTNLFVVLSELFNNALDHGLLRLDSKLKGNARGMDRFLELRTRRLRALNAGSILIDFDLDCGVSDRVRIEVSDSGDGFDWRALAANDENAAFGRGILLVRRLCSSLEYSDRGNQAVAVYGLH